MKKNHLLNFITQIQNWEFWPWQVVYFPVFIYVLWLALKNRSLFFFTAVNPGMETGGMYGDSKYRQLIKLPSDIRPKTLLFVPNTKADEVIQNIRSAGIAYPLITKPDKTQRGIGVIKVQDEKHLEAVIHRYAGAFIVQEYIDLPFEAGVFYYRFPGERSGHIPSVVIKSFLKVKGDGQKTVEELLQEIQRGRLVLKKLKKRYPEKMMMIPACDEETIIEPIGNHNRGTAFLDGNYLVNDQMVNVFNKISDSLDGVYYCRIDLKATSEKDLYSRKGVSILEINGVNSEPAHIYDPRHSIIYAWQT